MAAMTLFAQKRPLCLTLLLTRAGLLAQRWYWRGRRVSADAFSNALNVHLNRANADLLAMSAGLSTDGEPDDPMRSGSVRILEAAP
jgi:hypothetical protein